MKKDNKKNKVYFEKNIYCHFFPKIVRASKDGTKIKKDLKKKIISSTQYTGCPIDTTLFVISKIMYSACRCH